MSENQQSSKQLSERQELLLLLVEEKPWWTEFTVVIFGKDDVTREFEIVVVAEKKLLTEGKSYRRVFMHWAKATQFNRATMQGVLGVMGGFKRWVF